jgi:heat shock protein beta
MDMIVNSLYSNKDIFMRELVSNASDALDKARFLSIERPTVLSSNKRLEIRIKSDVPSKTLIIEDDGIGMTSKELIHNLGTIARSGTAKFVEALQDQSINDNTNQIGQFGVGFYSVFLISDKVRVQSKHPDSIRQWIWESVAGSHQFKVYRDELDDIGRGTRITLTVKDEYKDYLDPTKIQGIIKQYSEFLTFPINLWLAEDVDKQTLDDAMTQKRQEFENRKAKDEARNPQKVEPVFKTEWKREWKYALINDRKPLWQRDPKGIADDEYNQFYKSSFKEFLDPLAHSHFSVEGMYEFKGLIFIPGLAPFDFSRDTQNHTKSIRLYVKRVFISDSFQEELVPTWLSFIKCIVDSADLPLNVSREILQESRIVRTIRRQIVSRSLTMIKNLQSDESKSKTFWESFGKNIKMGIVEDSSNRDELSRLCRFHTSHSSSLETNKTVDSYEVTTLASYLTRMKPEQAGIYYFATNNLKAAIKAPFVERLIKKDYEILLMNDPLDEYVVMNLARFKSPDSDQEYTLIDVTRENAGIEDHAEARDEVIEEQKKFHQLCLFIKNVLGEKVEKVTLSTRLDSSPCVLVTSKFGWSANMEQIMKAQAGADARAYEYMRGRRSMEINPRNYINRNLLEEIKKNEDSEKARTAVEFMYQTALLTSGFELDDPQAFSTTIFSLLERSLDSKASD